MQAFFYKKERFPTTSRQAEAANPTAAGKSHRLPPVFAMSQTVPQASAAAAQPLTAPAVRSPAAGPSAQLTASVRARPPSRGRTGSRLKSPSTTCAPAAAVQGSPAQSS